MIQRREKTLEKEEKSAALLARRVAVSEDREAATCVDVIAFIVPWTRIWLYLLERALYNALVQASVAVLHQWYRNESVTANYLPLGVKPQQTSCQTNSNMHLAIPCSILPS